jgi:hypothetical protein
MGASCPDADMTGERADECAATQARSAGDPRIDLTDAALDCDPNAELSRSTERHSHDEGWSLLPGWRPQSLEGLSQVDGRDGADLSHRGMCRSESEERAIFKRLVAHDHGCTSL